MTRPMQPLPDTAHAGRPRDSGIDDAVLVASADLLHEQGYSAFSIGAAAERAGTTRPAIYRRWPVRQELAIAALARQLDFPPPVDSECTRCDLIGAVQVFTGAFLRSLPPRVLAPLIADCATEPRLYDLAMKALFAPLRAATREVLDRAAARGDLRADADPELVLDLLASIVHYRSLFGHAPITSTLVENQVDTLLRGIATDYPGLVATSRARGHGDHHRRTAADGDDGGTSRVSDGR